jgi:hypothetical protein
VGSPQRSGTEEAKVGDSWSLGAWWCAGAMPEPQREAGWMGDRAP